MEFIEQIPVYFSAIVFFFRTGKMFGSVEELNQVYAELVGKINVFEYELVENLRQARKFYLKIQLEYIKSIPTVTQLSQNKENGDDSASGIEQYRNSLKNQLEDLDPILKQAENKLRQDVARLDEMRAEMLDIIETVNEPIVQLLN